MGGGGGGGGIKRIANAVGDIYFNFRGTYSFGADLVGICVSLFCVQDNQICMDITLKT